MKLHNLSPAPNSRKKEKRVGRGIGSGMGKTSTRGHKGQNSRSGGGVRPGFEGGQMPLVRRVPKRGFTNKWREEYLTVNISRLNAFENGATVTAEDLLERGLIKYKADNKGLKVLGDGELKVALTVKAAKFSKSAEEAIIKAGGKAEVV
ncbi:MAG: 50S ribosomal protein L15 [Clostridiales bacterium]|jgi:large subunit ribosomal protein L15|nr:50S ribosomal protein L15 [Clostridiales bacterium]